MTGTATGAGSAAAACAEAGTLGVEEEYQLLDRETGALVSRGRAVLATALELAAGLPGAVQGELPLSQVESATGVCTDLPQVRHQLCELRRVLGAAAAAHGCTLAASSSPPLGDGSEQQADDTDPRFAAMVRDKGYLVDRQFIAGMHVHVGIPNRDRAVAVMDRTRVWLPVTVALSANSPYWLGTDTGFASYRTVHWGRWPVADAPPLAGDAVGYDALTAQLVATGVVRDIGQLYWQTRPSARLPTLEFRACDVPSRVGDAVALAGLHRALARRALADLDEGVPVPVASAELLRAANWRAARYGLRDTLVDPRTGAQQPAADVVAALHAYVEPHLGADAELVGAFLADVLAHGTGADRQRAAAARGGLRAVAAHLAAETAEGVTA